MFEQYVEYAHEILAEVGAEVAGDPLRLVAEVAQFLILIAIVWAVAFGFGKRKGFVTNMLNERYAQTMARIEGASHTDDEISAAKRDAGLTTREARKRARAMIAEAKQECVRIQASSEADTQAECARIHDRAEAALETERQEMLLELREQLVELVSAATRAILNEKVSVTEQRSLIENAISTSVTPGSTPRHAVGVGVREV